MGISTVASSSVVTGQLNKRTKCIIDNGFYNAIKTEEFKQFPKQELITDAFLGSVLFSVILI